MKIISEKLKLFFNSTNRQKLWLAWTSNMIWIIMLFSFLCCLNLSAENDTYLSNLPALSPLDCKSALLMEAETGCILYEQNADEALPLASVTKVMTLLLTMEAIENGSIAYDQMLTASSYASSMGGTQIFLEVGEQMSVEDLLKSVIIASANDAAVVLAEAVAGSEETFVSMMNNRASELGMNNTHFENTNGLDDSVDNHVSCARDIAIMSRELIKHDRILEYSSIWMDSIRNGEFGLTNTNRLIRFYDGATGLKTGSTSKAKFCISATAKRDGMHLIAVIMGAPTRDIRNAEAVKLFDWGFSNYTLYVDNERSVGSILLHGSKNSEIECKTVRNAFLVPKSKQNSVSSKVEMNDSVWAPIRKNDTVGKITYYLDNKKIYESNIVSVDDADRISFVELLILILQKCVFR